ncbi:MAG: PQQ-binding-like beta-propeller repeat protein, partial [Candidatus Hydrothermarchaeaceae archaeon]
TVAISSNGDYIAAGSYDNNVYLFDKSGTLLWKYKTDDVVLSTSISSNGDYIAAGSYDNHMYLFDKSGRLLFKYRTDNVLFSTSISSNGDYIAAGSYDNNVYLFDKSGNLLFEYMTEDEVWDVAISSDGSYISAASKDFNVYFFSSTGELLGKHSTGGYVSSVAISENGDYATAGSYDRSISFFSITPAPPVELETPKVNVLKTVTKSSLKPGENATVLIELKNVGEITARIVEFEDVIPEGFILVSGELSSITELIPGESKTFSYVIKAEEIKEQKEVVLPALDVSYIDIKGNQYTARSSDVFITLLPGKVRVLPIGLKERLGSVLSSISKSIPKALPGAGMKERLSAAVLSFLKVILIVLAALFSFAFVRRVSAGRKTRRKIDKTEILTKIRKEIGVTGPGPSQMLPEDSKRAPQKALKKPIFGKSAYRKEKINLLKRLKREVKRAPHEAPADIVTEKASTQHKPAMVTKSRFGKPTYRKDMINLLKSLKREVKK